MGIIYPLFPSRRWSLFWHRQSEFWFWFCFISREKCGFDVGFYDGSLLFFNVSRCCFKPMTSLTYPKTTTICDNLFKLPFRCKEHPPLIDSDKLDGKNKHATHIYIFLTRNWRKYLKITFGTWNDYSIKKSNSLY